MVKHSDIKVVLPCVFPNSDPLWMILHTCRRFKIDPVLYGLNGTYAGWVDMKIKRLRRVAEDVLAEGNTHLFYTDARDAWFCAGLEEITEKYNALGAPPILLSAQADRFWSYEEWYKDLPWDESLHFPFVGTPGMLCDARALADALQHMIDNYPFGEGVKDSMPDDDPPWWNRYWKEFPDAVKFDHQCQIFMNAGSYIQCGMWEGCLEMCVKDGIIRVHNRLTDTYPCTIHFNGGGSDALKGKWESLERHWREFGYTINPPWETK